jgi:hypothetical protein
VKKEDHGAVGVKKGQAKMLGGSYRYWDEWWSVVGDEKKGDNGSQRKRSYVSEGEDKINEVNPILIKEKPVGGRSLNTDLSVEAPCVVGISLSTLRWQSSQSSEGVKPGSQASELKTLGDWSVSGCSVDEGEQGSMKSKRGGSMDEYIL